MALASSSQSQAAQVFVVISLISMLGPTIRPKIKQTISHEPGYQNL
jgi:hypothetical protein